MAEIVPKLPKWIPIYGFFFHILWGLHSLKLNPRTPYTMHSYNSLSLSAQDGILKDAKKN